MKNRRRKATPEESLRASCEEGMGVELDYTRVRERLDVEAITRAGAGRKAASSPTPIPAVPPRRSAIPAVCLVLAVLILTPALAVGSFLIARSTMDPAPPDEGPIGTLDDMPPLGTNPDQSLTPGGSTIVTPRPITPNTTGEAWGNLFDLSAAYTTDDVLFLRAEHLDPALTDGTLPAVLTIHEPEEWQQFCGDATLDLTAGSGETTEEFFAKYSLQIIITEGRSGSIRYRLEEVYTTNEKVHRAWGLVAEVPLALTMDIVHWCIVIPVSKAEAQVPVILSMRDVYEVDAGVLPSVPDIETPDPAYKLWFESDSYAQNGCLYGRLGYNDHWSYPYTKSVNTLAEWESLYLGCTAGSVSDGGFTEGLSALDEAFFAEQSLLILYLEESSGSIRHSIGLVGIEKDQLSVTVTSKIPELCTDDMAYWAILIPISKEYADRPLEVEYTTARLD